MRHAWLAIAGLLMPCLAAAPAVAQMDSREGIALQNQILEMRRDLQALQSQRGQPSPTPLRASSGGGGNVDSNLRPWQWVRHRLERPEGRTSSALAVPCPPVSPRPSKLESQAVATSDQGHETLSSDQR